MGEPDQDQEKTVKLKVSEFLMLKNIVEKTLAQHTVLTHKKEVGVALEHLEKQLEPYTSFPIPNKQIAQRLAREVIIALKKSEWNALLFALPPSGWNDLERETRNRTLLRILKTQE